MSRRKDRFHAAAKMGCLEVLKEATRKDCDTRDRRGMTPVVWAALYGQLESLRLLMMRGGSPDKPDYYGNSPLHFAAARGHLHCVTFLVNYGANLWALDVDMHSALEIASITGHYEVATILDGMCAHHATRSSKSVQRSREKATNRAQKLAKRFSKHRRKSVNGSDKSSLNRLSHNGHIPELPENHPLNEGAFSSPLRNPLAKGGVTQDQSKIEDSDPKRYSDYSELRHARPRYQQTVPGSVRSNGRVVSGPGGAVAKRAEKKRTTLYPDENESCRISLSSFSMASESDWDAQSVQSRAISEPDFAVGKGPRFSGLLERPGWGNLAFFSKDGRARSLSGLPMGFEEPQASTRKEDWEIVKTRLKDPLNGQTVGLPRTNLASETNGIQTRRLRRLPWDASSLAGSVKVNGHNTTKTPATNGSSCLPDEDYSDDEDDDLGTFLVLHGLQEYRAVFEAEKIDLPALMLCSDDDLKAAGLPLGPRRKLLDAMGRRQNLIDRPGKIMDTYL